MDSKYNVVQVSTGPACVHRYYDTPCISPNGKKLMYSRFSGEIPGPADVVIADADGSNTKAVASATGKNIGHVGAKPSWIDEETISFAPEGDDIRTSAILSLNGGGRQDYDGNIRQVHQQTRKALILAGGNQDSDDEFERRKRTEAYSLDLDTNEKSLLFTIKDAAEVHPKELDLSTLNFMNSKWSPDGSQFSVVFTNEIYRKVHGGERTTKCLILADADGSNLRYLGEFGHHPLWTPDGTGIIAHNVKPKGGQELVLFSLEPGKEPELLLDNFIGVHSTLNKAATHVITDGFNFPEEGKASVLRYELATGKQEILCTGNQKEFDHTNHCHLHPQFNADESRIFFNMEDTGRPQVYSLELL